MVRVLLLMALTIAVSAYDFKNSEFNEVILENYKLLRDSLERPESVRVIRHVGSPMEDDCKEKKGFSGIKCCNGERNMEAHNFLEALQKQCVNEIYDGDDDENDHYDPFNCENMEEMKTRYVCIAECLGRKLNLINGNSSINRDMLVQAQKQFIGAASDVKFEGAEKIAKKCSAQPEAIKNYTGNCNPTSAWMFFCMWKEYVVACPKELQVNTRKCDRIRERLETQDSAISSEFYNSMARRLHKHRK